MKFGYQMFKWNRARHIFKHFRKCLSFKSFKFSTFYWLAILVPLEEELGCTAAGQAFQLLIDSRQALDVDGIPQDLNVAPLSPLQGLGQGRYGNVAGGTPGLGNWVVDVADVLASVKGRCLSKLKDMEFWGDGSNKNCMKAIRDILSSVSVCTAIIFHIH